MLDTPDTLTSATPAPRHCGEREGRRACLNREAYIVRPGRFDELFTVDSLGAAYFRDVLGLGCWEALSPENRAKVEAWPAAFLNELRLRFEHLPGCNVNAEFAALATRVAQNSRPTWATAAFTAVPTTT
jgi:hypothetical protein